MRVPPSFEKYPANFLRNGGLVAPLHHEAEC